MGQFLHHFLRLSSRFHFKNARGTGEVSLLYDRSGNRKYLTIKERTDFLRAARRMSPPAYAYCAVLAYTGARLSEALSLTAMQVDLDNRLLVFESLKKRRRGVFRAVPVPLELLTILDREHGVRRRQREPVAAREALFKWGRTTAWGLVKDAMANADIFGPQASPKGLRHGFAIAALQSGVPINLVRKWLGHSRLATTAIYADAMGEEEQQLAKRLWDTFETKGVAPRVCRAVNP